VRSMIFCEESGGDQCLKSGWSHRGLTLFKNVGGGAVGDRISLEGRICNLLLTK
jgi:hypothetical protein